MAGDESEREIDLGHEHFLRYLSWSPDRSIPANAERYADIPDIERYGAIIRHRPGPHPDVPPERSSGWCEGGLTFDNEATRRLGTSHATWTVESWDPLAISPSVLCSCGDHGFVRGGQWIPA